MQDFFFSYSYQSSSKLLKMTHEDSTTKPSVDAWGQVSDIDFSKEILDWEVVIKKLLGYLKFSI